MTYDIIPIHAIHTRKVIAVNLGCFRQSGMVSHKTNVIGHRKRNIKKLVSAGFDHGLSAKSAWFKFFISVPFVFIILFGLKAVCVNYSNEL